MQPNSNRRPKMDVFRDVEDARPEELRAARVKSNFEVSKHPKPKGSKTSKSDNRLEVDSTSERVDALDDHDVSRLLKEASYLPEAEDGIANALPREPTDNSDSDNPPIRILSNFFIFDSRSLNFMPLSSLWEIDTPCEACGDATADADEDPDYQEFSLLDGIPFRTSTIMSYSLDIHQDSIWIQTQYAWYILETPVKEYQPFYLPFYSREMLLRHILRNILVNHDMTRDELLCQLASPLARDLLLKRCWNEEDLSSFCQYSLSEFTEVIAAIPGIDWNDIKDAPLLRLLLKTQESISFTSNGWDKSSQEFPSTPCAVRGPAPPRKRKRTTLVESVPTTITPIVHAMVSPYFEYKFTVVSKRPSFLNDEKLARGQPQRQISSGNTKYRAGDFVIVNEGDFEDETSVRFAQILFLDQRNKNIHARWFIHGSETILQEVAHGQELFLSIADDCRDVSTDCIVSRCNVMRISLVQHATQTWPGKDAYFYTCAWDRRHPAGFTEVMDDQVDVPSLRICPSCEARDAPISSFISSTKCIIRSIEYHQDDYIRYAASTSDQLTCSIGQISTFIKSGDGVKLRVYRLGRERDRQGPGYFAEPALFLTSIGETVNAPSVLGTCQVLHISEFEVKDHTWLDKHPNCFYILSRATSLSSPLIPLPITHFKRCQICHQLEEERYGLEMKCWEEKKLCAFDPFAGVGGFGLGLAQGCSVQTIMGVDNDASAAETMRRNFPPDTTVLTADANKILRDLVKGRVHKLVHGQVDMIYSGPPCQNDSTLNRYKTDTKRPSFTTLSFVDFLRPAIFIMESVPGFLQGKVLQGSPNEIRAGDLKLLLKTLHFLGYNVMGQLMHSRSFGVPQTRDRFFIVATLPEWGAFDFPEVSHSFKRVGQPRVLSCRLGPRLKLGSTVAHGRALHEVITVAETLSDLPFFDWTSPKKLTRDEKADAQVRASHIPAVPCHPDEMWGIRDADFKYEIPSANAYQQRARRDLVLCPKNSYQHFTKRFPAHQVENICDLSLARGADYRHLDQKNREWSLRDPASAKAMGGYQAGAYSRLNPDGYFHTIVTYVGPVAKQSSVIHPFCKRTLTVRELARAQGFPDDFVFYSETDKIDDYHRQIGNSVPFGVSAALGRSIQNLVFKKWLKDRKQ